LTAVGAAPAKYTRGGKIVSCAKIDKPVIMNLNVDEIDMDLSGDLAYFAVTVKSDNGRKISVADYSLEVMNFIKVPCIAVKIGNGNFDAAPKVIDVPENSDVTLLFAAEARDCVDELPDKTILNIAGAANGRIARRNTTLLLTPPLIDIPNPAFDDPSYIFFEMEVVAKLPAEIENVSVSCNDFELVFNNVAVKGIAMQNDAKGYSNGVFNMNRDSYATVLFAVKAADCIDDTPFKLHYNLAETGSRVTLL
jgi:hypothetical protein